MKPLKTADYKGEIIMENIQAFIIGIFTILLFGAAVNLPQNKYEYRKTVQNITDYDVFYEYGGRGDVSSANSIFA